MAVATSNFDAGLVQLAVQSGRVIQYQRNVCPTLALALGKDPIMADNDLANLKNVPMYGEMSNDEINAGYIRSFFAPNASIGGSVTRANMTALVAASPFVGGTTEALNDFTVQTCYYNDGGETISLARLTEGKGRGWAANMTNEELVASVMVKRYFAVRGTQLFSDATGSTTLPGDGVFGSLRAIISNGINNTGSGGTDESTYSVYGGRTRSATAPLQALYQNYTGSPATSIAQMDAAVIAAYANGATKVVAPMSTARFIQFRALVQAFGQIRLDEDMANVVNGKYAIDFNGCTYYADPQMPTGKTWQLFIDLGSPDMPNLYAKTAMQKSLIERVPNPILNNADRLRWGFPDQVIVRNPSTCVLVTGLGAA
jgi:hypothetical protein